MCVSTALPLCCSQLFTNCCCIKFRIWINLQTFMKLMRSSFKYIVFALCFFKFYTTSQLLGIGVVVARSTSTHWGGSTRVLGWTLGRLLAEAPIWLAERLSDCWFNKLEAKPAWYCNYTQIHRYTKISTSTAVCEVIALWLNVDQLCEVGLVVVMVTTDQ